MTTRSSRFIGFADDLLLGTRLLLRLPGWLRRPVSLQEARAELEHRLANRAETFLDIVRRGVFARPRLPYARLFRSTGCRYEDLEQLVRRNGLEEALALLFREGVYLTVDELKGRVPVKRGSMEFELGTHQLRNPLAAGHILAHSSGTRGPRTPVPVDLDFLRDRAVDHLLECEARGACGWRNAFWCVPGGLPVVQILWYTVAGQHVDRWFSQLDARKSGLPARYLWAQHLLHAAKTLARVEMPEPVAAPIDDPLPVARWMAGCVQCGQTPHLWTFATSALRLCRAAQAAGMDIRGAQFTVSGEPLTAVRAAEIHKVGAHVTTVYGTAETYAISLSCMTPRTADDSHIVSDLVALIQAGPGRHPSGLPATALLVTTLRPMAPLLLINASLGDQAELDDQLCGCPISQVGWRSRLRNIVSFEKLTAGGVTFLDSDIANILDAVLPTRFGGGPTSYQLLEEERADGQPSLALLVDPALGPLDAQEIADAFFGALVRIGDAAHVGQLQWRMGGWLEVRRARPNRTASGKVLHLHHR